MTVYNITKLSPNLAKSIAQYLGVNKIIITYSDWLNQFGIRTSKGTNISATKREITLKHITNRFAQTDIKKLISCPKIKRSTNND